MILRGRAKITKDGQTESSAARATANIDDPDNDGFAFYHLVASWDTTYSVWDEVTFFAAGRVEFREE